LADFFDFLNEKSLHINDTNSGMLTQTYKIEEIRPIHF